MMQERGTEFLNLIERVSTVLNPDENLVNPEYISRFHNRCKLVTDGIGDVLSLARNMKIGIVGEVKAGKSTFLNALIFDGESVLPQAATPMTAALTKITYAKDSVAKIVFYSDYDWNHIESMSNKYDTEFERLYNELRSKGQRAKGGHFLKGNLTNNKTHEEWDETETLFDDVSETDKRIIEGKIASEYRACKELTRMVISREINVGDLLNQTRTINIKDVKIELENYVGVNGEFTPVVKHIELSLDNEMLKGFEIIDTPGLNDPILSRSETTKKFLLNCDLIYLLSYSGQFLNSEDISFIARTLPSENIQHAVIIGSKFDSAILDYPQKRGQQISFKTALVETYKTLNKQAQSSLEECRKTNEFRTVGVISKLIDSLPPYYISSILYSISKKLKENFELTEFEEHVIKNLKSRFRDFENDPTFLHEVSNIDRVKSKSFEMIMKDKESIIEEKNKKFIITERINLLSMLEDINIQANKNLNDIMVFDKEKLENKIKILNTSMNNMRGQIKTIFEINAIEAIKYIKGISLNVKCIVSNYTDVETKSSQRTEHGSYTEGWWIFKQTKHYTEKVNIHTASVNDVIVNIRNYINKAEEIINEDISSVLNIYDIQKELKGCVLQAFDLSDTSFNERDILDPLELVMSRLTIPKLNIEMEIFNEMIYKSFSSSFVEGNQIHDLIRKQEEVLQKVTKAICENLDKMGLEIERTLKEKASTFVDDVNGHLEGNISALQAHLKNKDASIQRYQEFINEIKENKLLLQKFGGD